MKKTLIALAVAASAVSGMAHAWTDGDFNGSVDIGGTIFADTYNDKWEWMTGNSLSFQNITKNMSGENKVLTITQETPASILLGRTKEAFAAPIVGVGAIPLISFSDYENEQVPLQSSGEANKGFFNLPMKDTNGNKLGVVKINVTAAGLLASGKQKEGHVTYDSLFSQDNTSIYYGGLVSPVEGSSLKASELIAKFGNYDYSRLRAQVMKVQPDLSNHTASVYSAKSTNMVNTDGDVMASSYALGIDQGQTIEATFTTPVTTTTQWSAPLNVAVTYN